MTGANLERALRAVAIDIRHLEAELDDRRNRRVALIREASAAGLSNREIGRLAGISHVTVGAVLSHTAIANIVRRQSTTEGA